MLKARRYVLALIALILVTVAVSGCGGGIGSVLKIVGLEALLPEKWTSSSNVVRLIADILTDQPLQEVLAHVTRSSDSQVTEVVMTRNAEGKYEGSFDVPVADTGTTYTAVVTATDGAGNEATSESVQIEAPPAAAE
jgi:hypothetical protein